jgi:hypothetical protein
MKSYLVLLVILTNKNNNKLPMGATIFWLPWAPTTVNQSLEISDERWTLRETKKRREGAPQTRFLGAEKGRGEEAQIRFPRTFVAVTGKHRVQNRDMLQQLREDNMIQKTEKYG